MSSKNKDIRIKRGGGGTIRLASVVRVVPADERRTFDDTGACLLVQALRVTLLHFLEGSVDKDFYERDLGCVVDRAGERTVREVRRDESREGRCRRGCNELGDLGGRHTVSAGSWRWVVLGDVARWFISASRPFRGPSTPRLGLPFNSSLDHTFPQAGQP